MPWVLETERGLDLAEDADPVVGDGKLGTGCRSFEVDRDGVPSECSKALLNISVKP